MTEAELEAIRPVLEVAGRFANDRAEGQEQRAGRFVGYRFDMQQALAKFVDAGGELPS